MGGQGAFATERTNPSTSMEVKRPQEQGLFEIQQLKLSEMFHHKANFNQSFKWLTLCTKLLSV